MYPLCTDLDARFAYPPLGKFYAGNRVYMKASFLNHSAPLRVAGVSLIFSTRQSGSQLPGLLFEVFVHHLNKLSKRIETRGLTFATWR